MPKSLRTKMTQHSYTVGLCKNRCAEAHFQTKGSVLIFYDFIWRNFTNATNDRQTDQATEK